MKFFKVKATRTAPRYEINAKTFDEVTEHKYPFERINSNGELSQFGICPSCLNPTQLIGLTRKTKRNPYGKHTGKDINGLREWNQTSYEYCPYAIKGQRRETNDNEFLPEITKEVIELYDLLKNNFDRVVYVISKS